uniref:Uncharacterized protein n=1 Tax=Athene cunicularia TaxID=194338 RepID=A0A663MC97_ATHCN
KEMAHQTKQAPEFIESGLLLVIKSAEYMLWYKQALKLMQQDKVKLAVFVNSTPALKKSETKYSSTTPYSRKKSELRQHVENTHTTISDPAD